MHRRKRNSVASFGIFRFRRRSTCIAAANINSRAGFFRRMRSQISFSAYRRTHYGWPGTRQETSEPGLRACTSSTIGGLCGASPWNSVCATTTKRHSMKRTIWLRTSTMRRVCWNHRPNRCTMRITTISARGLGSHGSLSAIGSPVRDTASSMTRLRSAIACSCWG